MDISDKNAAFFLKVFFYLLKVPLPRLLLKLVEGTRYAMVLGIVIVIGGAVLLPGILHNQGRLGLFFVLLAAVPKTLVSKTI